MRRDRGPHGFHGCRDRVAGAGTGRRAARTLRRSDGRRTSFQRDVRAQGVGQWDPPGTGSARRMSVVVTDAAERHRYEATLDDTLAGFLDYVVKRERIALIHTEVPPVFAGHGVAAALTRFALDDARRRDLKVIAICPYVRRYLEKHPDDMAIVVGTPMAAE